MALLHGQGPIGIAGPTSDVFTTPFPHQPGDRARDNAGNEYVFVDYTGTALVGQPVAITSTYTAALVGTTGRGPIGIVTASATSDNAGWVQIFGRGRVVIGLGGTPPSPSDAANGPTTLSTSVATIFKLQTSATSPVGLGWTSDASLAEGYVVKGMIVAQDASIGDVSDNLTSLASADIIGSVGVFLNYPYVMYQNSGVSPT